METFSNKNLPGNESSYCKRRVFLKKGILLGTVTSTALLGVLQSCKAENEEVSPAEDLMREHGVLNRILLVYDTCRLHLLNNEQFDLASLKDAALIIRNFIEDYHEKLEEDFLFPRFEKANVLTVLVQVLSIQHKAGRRLTEQIIQNTSLKSIPDAGQSQKLIKLLGDFCGMYRPHESREDTVLFPAIKKIISRNEYFALGEDFEDKEHELFGTDGFESIVEKVASIEKQLGIYDLSKFTPS
jgi:hemerythrin-like domain-containing protein